MKKIVIECSPSEFKDRLNEITKEHVVNEIAFEPVSYKYTIDISDKTQGEEWRDIPGYVGVYQMSNLKRIRSIRTKVLGVDQKTVLTDSEGNRRNINIDNLYKLVFG